MSRPITYRMGNTTGGGIFARSFTGRQFAPMYLRSGHFDDLLHEGMKLVDDTAKYIDGPGEQLRRSLSANSRPVYIEHSLYLVDQLMSVAEWLLVHQEVREGRMTLAKSEEESRALCVSDPYEVCLGDLNFIPGELILLMCRFMHLKRRVRTLDKGLYIY